MEYSGLGFVDAVKDLAQSVGMKVPEQQRSEHSQQRAEQARICTRCCSRPRASTGAS